MRIHSFLVAALACSMILACTTGNAEDEPISNPEDSDDSSLIQSQDDIELSAAEPDFELSDDEWRQRLTDEEYEILRNHGTERAYSGDLLDNERDGIYHCAGCDHPVFSSDTRFDSGTGWPSYYAPLNNDAVGTRLDKSLGQTRVEVHCGNCAGHLGHVFVDGPEPTGLRYCLNSAALNFTPSDT